MMQRKQQFNPIFPLNEYVPDGEPHVFGDRVYLFGSHDKEGGDAFCMLDYVAYSAPVDDLKSWRYEGVIYRTRQDPVAAASPKPRCMYAPDVVRGNDGRYYLYYCLDGFKEPIRAAVCDTPAGRYEYLGYVRNPDGTPFLKRIPFDPGLINDNGTIRMYYGTAVYLGGDPVSRLSMQITGRILYGKTKDEDFDGNIMGANTVTLDDDMLTVNAEPKRIVPCQMEAGGTAYWNHGFLEASSIRKIGGKYYFIYSSNVNHELCYAVSDYPDREFCYGGVIISNGDIGYQGRRPKDRLNTTGNNHGSIEKINGEWYVFYHRHTHNRATSRQACAEKIRILPDGSIPQVEMTSCGLNGGNLTDSGEYPAAICCNLTDGRMKHYTYQVSRDKKPFITHDGSDRYITNIYQGVRIGYKYFDFHGERTLCITARGQAQGQLEVYFGKNRLCTFSITPQDSWKQYFAHISAQGAGTLRFLYRGRGRMELLKFSFTEADTENHTRRNENVCD